MLFGGRRSTTIPLVTEAFDWEHGVFLGATMSSETTAAASGKVGKLRFDPFAMLPFCGYNMADYFEHWLEIGRRAGTAGEAGGRTDKLPRLFYVNWFRKNEDGEFLWPGYGENSRVLEWIFRRCAGDADAHESVLGLVPAPGDLYTGGLDIPKEDLEAVLCVDDDEVREQLSQVEEHLAIFGDRLPDEICAQLQALKDRLGV
jgi:phosphoenolpyruvate carboxykinase (GTP)